MRPLTILTVFAAVLVAAGLASAHGRRTNPPTPLAEPPSVATATPSPRVPPFVTATPLTSQQRRRGSPAASPTPTLGPMITLPGLPVRLEAKDSGLWFAATDGSWRWRAPLEVGYIAPDWAPDGSRVAVQGRDGALYLVTPRQGVERLASRTYNRLLWARDGSGMLLMSYEHKRNVTPPKLTYRIHWLTTAGLHMQLATGSAPRGVEPAILGWLPEGRRALVQMSPRDLLEVDLTTGTVTPFAGLDGAAASSLSADGHWLALVRPPERIPDVREYGETLSLDQRSTLEVLNTLNGARWTVLRGLCSVLGTLWSPDSLRLAYSHFQCTPASGPPLIGVIDIARGSVGGVGLPLHATCAVLDSWSPDSSRVMFRGAACQTDGNLSAYRVLSAAGEVLGEDHTVAGPQHSGGLGASNRCLHAHQELRVHAPDGATTTLDRLDGLSGYRSAAWSPQFDVVAFVRTPAVFHDWFFDLDLSSASAQGDVVAQHGTPACPTSPDGAHLQGGVWWNFGVRPIGPNGEAHAHLPRGRLATCEWSPEGRQVAFAYHPALEDGRSVEQTPVAAVYDMVTRLLTPLGVIPQGQLAGWSRDGANVAYLSDGGRVRVADVASGEWLENYGGTGHVQDAAAVAWSPDTTRIAVAAGNRVLVHEIATGEVRFQTDLLPNALDWVAWLSPDRLVLSVSAGKGTDYGQRLYTVTPAGAAMPLPDVGPFRNPAVSPDGRWIAVPAWGRFAVLAADGTGVLLPIELPESKHVDWAGRFSDTRLRFHSPSCCL